MQFVDIDGCFGPAELAIKARVFDDLWAEVGHRFGAPGSVASIYARDTLARDVMKIRCNTRAELTIRTRHVFLSRANRTR